MIAASDFRVGDSVRHRLTGNRGTVRERDGDYLLIAFGWGEPTRCAPAHLELLTNRAPSVPACVSCGEPNEYQSGPFTCGKCRHEAALRAENSPPPPNPEPLQTIVEHNYPAVGTRVHIRGTPYNAEVLGYTVLLGQGQLIAKVRIVFPFSAAGIVMVVDPDNLSPLP